MSDNGRRYSTWAGVIPANGEVDIDRVGSYARLLSGDVGLQIRFDDEAPGNMFVGTGIDAAETFRRVTLINTTGADIFVELAIGRGKIDDSRLTVSGIVDVRDPGDNSSFSDLIAKNAEILAMMQNGELQRIALGKVGASKASFTAGTTPVTVIDPVTNTSGAIVRTANVAGGRGAAGGISVGTSAPAGWKSNGILLAVAGTRAVLPYPLYLEAGQGLYASANAPSASFGITWDILP